MLADLVNRADVRMIEGGCRPCFAPKPLDGQAIGSKAGGKKLQRHLAAKRQVFGKIDNAHSPATK